MKHRLLFVMVLSCVLLFSSCQSAPTNPPAISADPAPLSSSQLKDMQKEYPGRKPAEGTRSSSLYAERISRLSWRQFSSFYASHGVA